MKGQSWIFVLLCLSSFIGEIVFGSIFPSVQPDKTPVPDTITQQQEVTWPSENIATVQGIIVGEDNIFTRNIQADERIRGTNAESGRNDEAVSPRVVVVNTEQKPPTDEITVIRNNSEIENNKKLLHLSSD